MHPQGVNKSKEGTIKRAVRDANPLRGLKTRWVFIGVSLRLTTVKRARGTRIKKFFGQDKSR